MTKRTKKIGMVAVLLLLFIFSVFMPCTSIYWRILNQESLSLYQEKQYDRAIVVASKALKIVEKSVGKDHPDVATSLRNLGLFYDVQGQYAKAKPLYERALAIQKKAFGSEHTDVVTSIENLAGLYRATNRKEEADVLDQRAARIRAIKR